MKLMNILDEKEELYGKIRYCDVLGKYEDEGTVQKIIVDEIQENDICLLLIHQYYGYSYKDDGRYYFKSAINAHRKILQNRKYNRISI